MLCLCVLIVCFTFDTGLCQQHDVLYDQLTVEEHLRLYGEIKGLTKDVLEREVTEVRRVGKVGQGYRYALYATHSRIHLIT